MTTTQQSGFAVLSTNRDPFTGHRIGTLAAAIHALLRFDGPMSLDDILRRTATLADELGIVDQSATVTGHLRFWNSTERDPDRKRRVYLDSCAGWSVNPDALYDPEWQGGTYADARHWYKTKLA